MTDLFEEVEEQLRSDRYRSFASRAAPWLLGLAAAALIAALAWWGWSHYQKQATAKASETYAAGLDALDQGRTDDAVKRFTEASESQAKGYKSLALMQLGGLRLAKNDVAGAVKLFDQAADAAPDAMVGDAARLKSAFALLDTAPRKDLEGRLTPLMEDGRPYRVQAREALAFTKVMGGDLASARGDFVVISGMLDAPEGARARAKAAIGLIDSGSAKAVAQTVRAAAALPPPVLAPAAPAPAQPAQPQAPGPQ